MFSFASCGDSTSSQRACAQSSTEWKQAPLFLQSIPLQNSAKLWYTIKRETVPREKMFCSARSAYLPTVAFRWAVQGRFLSKSTTAYEVASYRTSRAPPEKAKVKTSEKHAVLVTAPSCQNTAPRPHALPPPENLRA